MSYTLDVTSAIPTTISIFILGPRLSHTSSEQGHYSKLLQYSDSLDFRDQFSIDFLSTSDYAVMQYCSANGCRDVFVSVRLNDHGVRIIAARQLCGGVCY